MCVVIFYFIICRWIAECNLVRFYRKYINVVSTGIIRLILLSLNWFDIIFFFWKENFAHHKGPRIQFRRCWKISTTRTWNKLLQSKSGEEIDRMKINQKHIQLRNISFQNFVFLWCSKFYTHDWKKYFLFILTTQSRSS